MVSNDAASYALVKAEAAAGGAEGQPLQGHSSQRQLSIKFSGPPLAAASTPGRRAESTASACKIHPLKIQKSRKTQHRQIQFINEGIDDADRVIFPDGSNLASCLPRM